MANPKDWPPVVGEQFVQAWVNLQELPGGMMQSNQLPHRYGPIPGTTSCLITTSPREAEMWRAEGKPVLAIYTAAGVKACRGGPGECAHNGACMYACGAALPCRFCNGSGKVSDEMCAGCMGTGEDAAASGVEASDGDPKRDQTPIPSPMDYEGEG